MTNAGTIQTINRKHYRSQEVTDFSGTYMALIPCGPQGGKVDRCPICAGHADHSAPLSCGLS